MISEEMVNRGTLCKLYEKQGANQKPGKHSNISANSKSYRVGKEGDFLALTS